MEMFFDCIDCKLFELLQQDVFLFNLELVECIYFSLLVCLWWVVCLKVLGVICKMVVLVDLCVLGYMGLVIIGVVLDWFMLDLFVVFEKVVVKFIGCLEVQLVMGEFDYFVKLCIQGIDLFNEMYSVQLIGLFGVCQVCIFVCLKEVFEIMVLFVMG